MEGGKKISRTSSLGKEPQTTKKCWENEFFSGMRPLICHSILSGKPRLYICIYKTICVCVFMCVCNNNNKRKEEWIWEKIGAMGGIREENNVVTFAYILCFLVLCFYGISMCVSVYVSAFIYIFALLDLFYLFVCFGLFWFVWFFILFYFVCLDDY